MVRAVVLALMGSMVVSASPTIASPGGERFFLSGVVVVEGKEPRAWLQEPTLTRDKPVVMRVGDRIGPWTLTAISPSRVELQGPAGKFMVPLHATGGPGVGSPLPEGTPQAVTSSASPSEEGTLRIEAGDPRRRESIQKLFGTFRAINDEARAQATAAPAAPAVARPPSPTAVSASSRPGARGRIEVPVGDPRRREVIQQLFGIR